MSPIDPQVRAFLDDRAAARRPLLSTLSPDAARAEAAAVTALIGPGPELARVRDLEIEVAGGRIHGRAYDPTGAGTATIVWFHGGGWVLGSLDTHDTMCRLLAQASGLEVVAVAYRLAPEHPFPIPLEDCWAALRHVARERSGPLVVGGDSAGGNLAAVCALRARDFGLRLSAQVLVYPVCDHDFDTGSYIDRGDEGTLLGRREMEWFWDHYLPEVAARDDPRASPLRWNDLSGVAPAILVLAGHDPLLDEGRAYADRLHAAGVSLSMRCDADMIHAYFQYVNIFTAGNAAVAWVGAELRAWLDAGVGR